MLIETSEIIENIPGPLYDLDVAASGAWIGVTEQNDNQSLSFNGRIVGNLNNVAPRVSERLMPRQL
jgi:hypothetical protein